MLLVTQGSDYTPVFHLSKYIHFLLSFRVGWHHLFLLPLEWASALCIVIVLSFCLAICQVRCSPICQPGGRSWVHVVTSWGWCHDTGLHPSIHQSHMAFLLPLELNKILYLAIFFGGFLCFSIHCIGQTSLMEKLNWHVSLVDPTAVLLTKVLINIFAGFAKLSSYLQPCLLLPFCLCRGRWFAKEV